MNIIVSSAREAFGMLIIQGDFFRPASMLLWRETVSVFSDRPVWVDFLDGHCRSNNLLSLFSEWPQRDPEDALKDSAASSS